MWFTLHFSKKCYMLAFLEGDLVAEASQGGVCWAPGLHSGGPTNQGSKGMPGHFPF